MSDPYYGEEEDYGPDYPSFEELYREDFPEDFAEDRVMDTAYVMVLIDPKTLQVVGVTCRSESPWVITRAFAGPAYKILATVCEGRGRDYDEACENAVETYRSIAPELAEKFPIDSGDTEVT